MLPLVRAARLRTAPTLIRHASALSRRPTGVCGVPWVGGPADFERAAAAAVGACNAAISQLPRARGDAVAALHLLDDVSNTICKVLDVAAFLREYHAQAAWREHADGALAGLGGYMYALNAHRPLHDALTAITESPSAMARLSPEQRRMALLLQAEFERDGILLSDEERAAVVALNNEIADLGGRFLRGASEVSDLRAAPPAQAAVETASEARRRAYVARHSAHASNLPVLHALRDRRAALARSTGFASFAAFATHQRMAGEPRAAGLALVRLSAATLPFAARELRAAAVALAAEGGGAPARTHGAFTDGGSDLPMTPLQSVARAVAAGEGLAPVRAWDAEWAEARSHVDGARALERARRFFPLRAVLRGLGLVAARVLGVALSVEPAAAAEAWDLPEAAAATPVSVLRGWVGAGGAPVSQVRGVSGVGGLVGGHAHDASPPSLQVLRCHLRHEAEGDLGTLFLELARRPGKPGGAAHFVIQCGRGRGEGRVRLRCVHYHASPTAGAASASRPRTVGRQGRSSERSVRPPPSPRQTAPTSFPSSCLRRALRRRPRRRASTRASTLPRCPALVSFARSLPLTPRLAPRRRLRRSSTSSATRCTHC